MLEWNWKIRIDTFLTPYKITSFHIHLKKAQKLLDLIDHKENTACFYIVFW